MLRAILKTFAERHPIIDDMSRNKACLYGLNLLIERKLIRIDPQPLMNRKS
jgi:hypothetical protein